MLAAYTYFASDLPEPNVLDGIRPQQSSYVYDRTGEQLLARFECQNREAVSFATLPDMVWQATVASEDRTFWENNGVDFQGIVRAALANLEAGEIVQGASTITQQVIDYARVLNEEGVEPGRPERVSRGERRRDRSGRTGDRPGGGAGGRCLPAAGAEQLDRHRGQDPGEHPGDAGHGRLSGPRRQGADPRDVPEPHLLRQRLVRHQGRCGELLRALQSRGSHRFADRLPGRTAPGAVVPGPLPEPERRARQRGGGCRRAAGTGSRHRRHARRRATSPPARRARRGRRPGWRWSRTG